MQLGTRSVELPVCDIQTEFSLTKTIVSSLLPLLGPITWSTYLSKGQFLKQHFSSRVSSFVRISWSLTGGADGGSSR